MGFLNPLFLWAGAIVLVPIVLHLFYRQESKVFTFPAIRYLLRTERERARQIRTQQLLLLLLRAAIVVLLVLLGARIHLPGSGGSHGPTALALVIDNSMSATIVQDGRRLLDTLKAVARRSVSEAGHDDVIWVVRAGTPWEPAMPGGVAQARAAIDATGPAHTFGDLGHAVKRARALVEQSHLPNREVHVFTDLQATALPEPPLAPTDVPVVVFAAMSEAADNRGIEAVSFGGGLPPLAGRRTEAAVSIVGAPGGDTVGVRLYIDGQVRAAARTTAGTTVRLPAGPFPAGRVVGHVEIDADLLTADDRRHFAFAVRDPTPVAILGPAPIFLTEALAVLDESERISLAGAARAATLVSVGGEGLERRGLMQSAFVVPDADPTRLPALNRRLAEAGIPYRYGPTPADGARVVHSDLPVGLGDIEIRRYFPLSPTDANAPAEADPTAARVSLSSGDPWLIAGGGPAGPHVLLASPLDEGSTTLPVSAAMISLLEWAIERGAEGPGEIRSVTAGTNFRPPPTATAVRDPEGNEHAVDGDQPFLATGLAGLYRPLEGDSVLSVIPVNPPARESDLTAAPARELRRAIPDVREVVDDAAAWSRHIFRTGRGPEPWQPIALLVLALLMAETVVAAARALRSRPGGREANRREASFRPREGRRPGGTAPNPAAGG